MIAWHFPNLRLKDGGRHYGTRFPRPRRWPAYVAEEFERLPRQTRLWHDTWYDSTLPLLVPRPHVRQHLDPGHLDLPIDSATAGSTAGKAWAAAKAPAPTCGIMPTPSPGLFPSWNAICAQRTDFGTALDPKSGVINHRGEGARSGGRWSSGLHPAGLPRAPDVVRRRIPQGALAENQEGDAMPGAMDDGEGILEGAQHNTLDQPWFGKIAWLSSLYVAAARACEEMAREMGDDAFAAQMREIVRARQPEHRPRTVQRRVLHPNPRQGARAQSVGSHNGCEIDQVFGQSWAWQVGLGPRSSKRAHVRTALASLWKYNFTPDVGPFRQKNKPGRWYAMAGEGGLIMCTWPKGDAARLQEGCDFYFNECMSGFEYQVAGHMIWEGMVQEGLAIARAIHDRYHASRRNPWNEVECGDHYARSMASYGVFLAACGYEYHGPKGYLSFDPKLRPMIPRCLHGGGRLGHVRQRRQGGEQRETIEVKYGQTTVANFGLCCCADCKPEKRSRCRGRQKRKCSHRAEGRRIIIELGTRISLQAGGILEATIA